MKIRVILVALALTMGATFNMIQAQCSDDCQCGKTTGSKGIIVDNRKVPGFSSIRLDAVGDIIFTQSDRCSVRIEGPQRYVSETTTKVEKETLVIGYKENNSNSKNVKLYIAAPDLKSVKLQGVGSFNCRTALRLDQLKITLSGVGGAEISDLVCETLKVRFDGVGSVNIRVDCDELTARADGVGSMTLKGKARKADISKGGVGGVNTRGLKVGE